MRKVYTPLGLVILKTLEMLNLNDKNYISQFFDLDFNSQESFRNYIKNTFKPYFNYNELQIKKYEFITTKIYEKEEPYYSYFEKNIKEEWIKLGLDEKYLDNLYKKDVQDKILKLPIVEKLSNDNFEKMMKIGNYYIAKNVPINIDIKSFENPILNYLNKTLNVENLLEEKMYKKYLQKRKNDICEYLNISQNQIIDVFYFAFTNISSEFSYTKNITNFDFFEKKSMHINLPNFTTINKNIKEKSLKNEFKGINNEAIQKAMSNVYYIIHNKCQHYLPIEKKLFNDYFLDVLESSLLIHLKNTIMFDKQNRDWSLSMIIRLTQIDNMEYFLLNLCNLFFENFLIHYLEFHIILLNKINKDEDFNKDKSFKIKLKEKEDEILKLKENISFLEYNKNKLNNELLDKNKTISNIQKNVDDKYKKQIYELEKQLDILNKKNVELENDNIELNEIRKTLLSLENEKEEVFDFSKIDLKQFEDKRYIFIGGRFELLKKLENIFPKGKFYHTKPQNGIDITKTDKIIIFPKNINHPMYWDAINLAKKNNIPFMFTLGTNLETIIKDIVQDENN